MHALAIGAVKGDHCRRIGSLIGAAIPSDDRLNADRAPVERLFLVCPVFGASTGLTAASQSKWTVFSVDRPISSTMVRSSATPSSRSESSAGWRGRAY
jgi:hypothetical protein